MYRLASGLMPSTRPGRLRLVVLMVALAATVFKLLIAAHTFGTDDVHYWIDFTQVVRDAGPIGIYGKPTLSQYNHPPLTGWLLVVLGWLVDNGVAGLPFLIRIPAILSDIVTALLLFELVRYWRSDREAAVAGVLVVASPVSIIVSGFHGNTDPVFIMLSLLSVYLTVVRKQTFLAGLAFAAALSVKLVPIILVPLLLVLLLRLGWRRLATFVGGAATLFVPLWGPVLLFAWPEFKANVLSYPGIWLREWGLPQFLRWAERPPGWVDLVVGPGRFAVLVLSAVLPALVVWRRSALVGPAVGLSLALFLLLSPAFGMQYLVWPLAAAYLVNTWAATVYNVAAAAFMVSVYDNWNSAYPWHWYEGVAVPFRSQDFVLMVLAWAALAGVVVVALVKVLKVPDGDAEPRGERGRATPAEPPPAARPRAHSAVP